MLNSGFSPLSDVVSLLALGATALIAVTLLPPVHPVIVILGSLKLHLTFVVLFLALTLLVFGQRWSGAFYLVAASAGFLHMALTLMPSLSPTATDKGTPVTVMSFNILGWNWSNGKRIAAFIEKTNPDVAFIQEASPLMPYFDELEKQFPYRIGCGRYSKRCDSVLLSRHPINAPDYYQPQANSPNRFYTTELTIDGRTLNLAAIHLTKAEFGSHLDRELSAAAQQINRFKDPVIIAGDFNTATWSPRLVTFLDASGAKHALIEPASWPGGRGFLGNFGLPIDHIFVRDGAIQSLETLPSNFGSNHRGLLAKLVIPFRD